MIISNSRTTGPWIGVTDPRRDHKPPDGGLRRFRIRIYTITPFEVRGQPCCNPLRGGPTQPQ